MGEAEKDPQAQAREMKALQLPAVLIVALAVVTSAFCAGYRAVRVTDGDTIKVVKDEKVVTVRLVGIDAPERGRGKRQAGQPYSRKATKYLANLVLDKEVTLKDYGVDRKRISCMCKSPA